MTLAKATKVKRACRACGSDFRTYNPKSQHCSHSCAAWSRQRVRWGTPETVWVGKRLTLSAGAVAR